ncbi:MAG: helix-turn-helix domain-containing protein [Verrucomicrobiia bacterium]
MMEWGSSRILALRKHAGMTQARFAQWLGVTIKQVKYLEHQRRNPSGPTRRLLDILAGQFHFSGTETVLVLGTDTARLRPPARNPKPPMVAATQPHDDGNLATKPPETAPGPDTSKNAPEAPATPSVSDDAFVWR